jgi:hypothetical protein
MGRSVRVLIRALLLAVVAIAMLIPALAFAQKPGECEITVTPKDPRCQAMLCAPPGMENYAWDGPGLPTDPRLDTQCITVTKSGNYAVKFFNPAENKADACRGTVFIDKCTNAPPDCSAAFAKDDLLWPPNHEMVPVEIIVPDPDGDKVAVTVYAVTQDEPLNVEGDGNTCADAEIVNGSASVRRERTGDPNIPGNGRVYTIYFVATDGKEKCKGSVKVCVPHDMGLQDTCIDDGQIHDSLGPCPEEPSGP